MTELARFSDYEGLVAVLRKRRIELGLTHLAVDEIAGLQTGYTGKIECGIKRLGAMSLTAIAGALRLEFVAMRAAGKHRNSSAIPCPWTIHRKKLSAKGGRQRKEKVKQPKRRAIARNAARVRWARAKREARTKRKGTADEAAPS